MFVDVATKWFGLKPRLVFAVLPMLFFMLGSMTTTATLTDTIVQFFNNGVECKGDTATYDDDCKAAATRAAIAVAFVNSINNFFCFLGAPVLGALSDSFGRRPAFIVTYFGVFLPYLFLFLYQSTGSSLYLYFVFKSMVGFCDFLGVPMAYVSDIITDADKLTKSFGIFFGILSSSMLIGPIMGLIITDVLYLYLMSSLSCFLGFICALFLLPESLLPEHRMKIQSWKRLLNPFKHFPLLNQTALFRRLAIVNFGVNMLVEGGLSLMLIYLKSLLGISQTDNVIIMVIFGLVCFVSQTGLISLLLRLKVSAPRILLLSVLAVCVGLLLAAAVFEIWQTYFLGIAFGIAYIAFPAQAPLTAKNVSERHQGRIQGALSGVRNLGGMLGPLLYTGLYSLFNSPPSDAIPKLPRLPYLLTLPLAIVLALLTYTMPKQLTEEETKRMRQLARQEAKAAGHTCLVTWTDEQQEAYNREIQKTQKVSSGGASAIENKNGSDSLNVVADKQNSDLLSAISHCPACLASQRSSSYRRLSLDRTLDSSASVDCLQESMAQDINIVNFSPSPTTSFLMSNPIGASYASPAMTQPLLHRIVTDRSESDPDDSSMRIIVNGIRVELDQEDVALDESMPCSPKYLSSPLS